MGITFLRISLVYAAGYVLGVYMVFFSSSLEYAPVEKTVRYVGRNGTEIKLLGSEESFLSAITNLTAKTLILVTLIPVLGNDQIAFPAQALNR